MRGDAGAFTAVHRSEHDGPGGEADAQKRAMAEFGLDPVAGSPKALLYLQRRAAGAQRPVFERGRRAEQCQNAVAGEILHRAAMPVDRSGGEARDLRHQRKGCFLARPLDKGGEADEVGHQDGNLAMLALAERPTLLRRSVLRGIEHLTGSGRGNLPQILTVRSA
jgi:hypothetical protein